MRTLLKIIIGFAGLVLVGLLVIQMVPVERTNPPVVREPNWDSAQTRALMDRACLDCHSNETNWPWYAYVAPVSWLVANDVQEGRAAVNFSEWQPGRENESVEAILEGEMPLEIYLITHPEARLSKAETQALIAGLEATLGPGSEGGEEHETDAADEGQRGEEKEQEEDDDNDDDD
jgi:hypothetical protein